MVGMPDKARQVGRMLGDAGAIPLFRVKTPMTPMTYTRCAALGKLAPELVCLPWKALTWDTTKMLQFVVIQPVGYTPRYFTDGVKVVTVVLTCCLPFIGD